MSASVDLVVAQHAHLLAQLAEVLHQVVGEASRSCRSSGACVSASPPVDQLRRAEQRARLVLRSPAIPARAPSRRRCRRRPARTACSSLHDAGADRDRHVHVAGEAEVAAPRRRRCRACTGSSSSMISIARTFGAPVSVPAGKVAAARRGCVMPSFSSALDVADDVHHVRVALDDERLGHLARCRSWRCGRCRCAPGRSASGARRAPSGRRAARPRARLSCSGVAPRGRVPASGRSVTLSPSGVCFLAHQDLGRRADDLEVADVVEVHVRRRVERAQRAVQRQRATRCSACAGAGRSAPASCRRRRCIPWPARTARQVVGLGELALDGVRRRRACTAGARDAVAAACRSVRRAAAWRAKYASGCAGSA